MSRNVVDLEASLVRELLEKGEVRLIDVREAAEHAAASIPGDEWHPLSTFNPSSIPPSPQKTIFYCRSGQRSHAAALLWSAHHATPSYNLKGGILSFTALPDV